MAAEDDDNHKNYHFEKDLVYAVIESDFGTDVL